MPYREPVRQMHWEYGNGDCVLVHVTLLPADTMGDLKTNPTQHSVKALRELGLEADLIVGRSTLPVSLSTKRKISSFWDVDVSAVISATTAPDTYLVPMELEKEGMADILLPLLKLSPGKPDNSWYSIVSREYTNRVRIGIPNTVLRMCTSPLKRHSSMPVVSSRPRSSSSGWTQRSTQPRTLLISTAF